MVHDPARHGAHCGSVASASEIWSEGLVGFDSRSKGIPAFPLCGPRAGRPYVSAPVVHGHSAVGGYSGNAVKPIALRFIAELGQNPALQGMHLSAMGGIETWQDALEFILLGAGSIQVTTAVMQYGYRIIDDLKAGLNLYLTEKGFGSIREAMGLALDSLSPTTDTLERDTVIFPQFNLERCIGCGRCQISCANGGQSGDPSG